MADYSALLCVLLSITACLFRTGHATYGHNYYYPPSKTSCDSQDGKPCTPNSYYEGNVCGERQLISVTTTDLSGDRRFGPNVCKTEYLYGRNAYRYEKSCALRYSWYGGYKCKCSCEIGSVCDVPITTTKSQYHCCDGFTTRPVASDRGKTTYYYEPNSYNILCTEGCPVEVQDTVLDCLDELGLTEMRDLLCETDLERVLNSADRTLTVFGVSNDTLMDTGIRDLMDEEIEEVLSRHVIESEKPLRSISFVDGQSHETLIPSCLVHVREIDEYKRVWNYHYGYSQKHVGDQIFISGSEIVARDACIARNGVVHVVNKPVECSNETIASIVEEDTDYSILESLLVEANKLSFLDMERPLLTLLAPTNEAFMNSRTAFGYDIVSCLRSNTDVLRKFLHYHIVCNAEFSSTLILEDNTLKTKACETVQKEKCHWTHWYYYGKKCKVYSRTECQELEVTVGASGIQVGETSDNVFLTGLDIPASNGVIHEISLPLRVPTVDFDSLCSGFVGVVGPPPPMPPPPAAMGP